MTIKLDWLRGCATALVTPFHQDLKVDEDCFRQLCKRQLENGVKLLVPCGTTGESVTMSETERLRSIEIAVEVARESNGFVIAGTGSNNTAAAIEFTIKARNLGANAALVVAPYYNKPTQAGLYQHFRAIAAAAADFPIVLYNVPGRTASNISAETTLRLAHDCENIVATKEASGDFSQIMRILRERPANFKVFSGDDATTLPLIALGADGLVSVCANEIPNLTVKMVEAALENDFDTARMLHNRILPLMDANFIESSPAPCKFVMTEMNLLKENLRLPLVPIEDKTRETLRKICNSLELF